MLAIMLGLIYIKIPGLGEMSRMLWTDGLFWVTQYGQIPSLSVPKLRQRNAERNWEILERYQRSLGSLLDWMCCLYVMGLSLRDLQYAFMCCIESSSIHKCCESNYPTCSTTAKREADGTVESDPGDYSGGWSLGRNSICHS